MPAATTALTVVAPSGNGGLSRDIAEQNSVLAGNNFVNDGEVYLFARNTTVAAISLGFEAHINGVETTVHTEAIPGSGTDGGSRIIGPFKPSLFNAHAGVDGDRVYVRQLTGTAGQVVLCPFKVPSARG